MHKNAQNTVNMEEIEREKYEWLEKSLPKQIKQAYIKSDEIKAESESKSQPQRSEANMISLLIKTMNNDDNMMDTEHK